jgi:hypothetical protein
MLAHGLSFNQTRSFRFDHCLLSQGLGLLPLLQALQAAGSAPISLEFNNCTNFDNDMLVQMTVALLNGTASWHLAVVECGITTEGLERLGTLLLYAGDEKLEFMEQLVLVEKRIRLKARSVPELRNHFVRNRAINLLLLGESGAGKTQLEASLRGLKVDPCLHTLGANSVSAGIRLKRQASKGINVKSLFSRSPSEAPAIPGSDFVLGDVLEIGGQHEYRYLYQLAGGLFHIHVIVLRRPETQALETLKTSLLERMQLLWHRYSRESQLHCPAILVVVNCTREQVSGDVNN